MSKKFATLSLCLAVSAMSSLPALALDGDDIVKSISATSVRLVAFSVGAVVGTPIAVLRMAGLNSMKTTNDLASKSDKMFVKAGAPLVGFPVGIVTGSLEGLYLGPKNSWDNAAEHPFSKDIVSLGDLKD